VHLNKVIYQLDSLNPHLLMGVSVSMLSNLAFPVKLERYDTILCELTAKRLLPHYFVLVRFNALYFTME
jgi:hypothetical protein